MSVSRLHLGGGVDVGHDDGAGVLGLPGAQLVGGQRIGQRAAGVGVRDQHGLLRRQDLRGLGHEVHAAEHDGRLRRGRRDPGQGQRVADVVGDVLDLRHLVVVRQDDGVALASASAWTSLRPLRRSSRRRIDRRSSVGAVMVSSWRPPRCLVTGRGFRLTIDNMPNSIRSSTSRSSCQDTHVGGAGGRLHRPSGPRRDGCACRCCCGSGRSEPDAGRWALPGGLVLRRRGRRRLRARQLAEKVDLHRVAHLEQIGVFSDPGPGAGRPGGGHRIPRPGADGRRPAAARRTPPGTRWTTCRRPRSTTAIIAERAHRRLQAKLSYTNIGFALAPAELHHRRAAPDLRRGAGPRRRPDQPAAHPDPARHARADRDHRGARAERRPAGRDVPVHPARTAGHGPVRGVPAARRLTRRHPHIVDNRTVSTSAL